MAIMNGSWAWKPPLDVRKKLKAGERRLERIRHEAKNPARVQEVRRADPLPAPGAQERA